MFGDELTLSLGVRRFCVCVFVCIADLFLFFRDRRNRRQTFVCETQKRITSVQSLSGTGAVRLGFELVKVLNPEATVYIPNPTWRASNRASRFCRRF